MTQKRTQALEVAEIICDSGETDVEFGGVKSWSDEDLYEWIESWGYTWEGDDGWVYLEDA